MFSRLVWESFFLRPTAISVFGVSRIEISADVNGCWSRWSPDQNAITTGHCSENPLKSPLICVISQGRTLQTLAGETSPSRMWPTAAKLQKCPWNLLHPNDSPKPIYIHIPGTLPFMSLNWKRAFEKVNTVRLIHFPQRPELHAVLFFFDIILKSHLTWKPKKVWKFSRA